jgi:hypothetical protein
METKYRVQVIFDKLEGNYTFRKGTKTVTKDSEAEAALLYAWAKEHLEIAERGVVPAPGSAPLAVE